MKKKKEQLDNTIDVTAEIIDVTEVETRMSTINEQIGNIRQATIEAKKEKFKEKEKEQMVLSMNTKQAYSEIDEFQSY